MAFHQNVHEATEAVKERIESAARRAGRNAGDVKLLAVTKFHPIEAIYAAYDAGIRLFGENRVQEAENKFHSLERKDITGYSLHMIGNLQSNKVNRAVELFDCIESVGDTETMDKVLRAAIQKGRSLGLFFELHTGEETKGGFASLDSLLSALERFFNSLSLVGSDKMISKPIFQGLMTMAPFTADQKDLRAAFRKMASTRNAILDRFPEIHSLELSMGMSGDFEIAIEEGSTLVRIGSALFGERNIR